MLNSYNNYVTGNTFLGAFGRFNKKISTINNIVDLRMQWDHTISTLIFQKSSPVVNIKINSEFSNASQYIKQKCSWEKKETPKNWHSVNSHFQLQSHFVVFIFIQNGWTNLCKLKNFIFQHKWENNAAQI